MTALLVWASALVMVLVARGITIFDSLVAVALVAIQLPIGLLIWLKVQTRWKNDWPTLIAASLGIGSVIVAVVDQLLVNVLQVTRIGAIVPGLIALPFALAVTKKVKISRTSSEDISLILAAVASALMQFAWGSADPSMVYGALLLFLTAALIVALASRQLSSSLRHSLVLAGSALVVVLVMIRTQQYVPDDLPRVLRDLSLGSDDQVKSEQLSYSLASRGLFSNAAAVDLPIKFHWMSLAWVGAMTAAGSAEPFLNTLHLAPLAAITAIGLLASHIVRSVSNNRWLAVVAPIVAAVTANPDGAVRSVFALTTSNVVPHLWIVLLLVVMLQFDQIQDFSNVAWRISLIVILPSIVMLGKGPYGATIAVGLVFAFVAVLVLPQHRGVRTKLSLAFVGAIGLQSMVYLAFLRSELTDRFDLRMIWQRFPYPLPFRYSTSPGVTQIAVGLVLMLLFLTVRFGPVLALGWSKHFRLSRFFVFGCAAGGMASFLVSQSDGTILGSETYFVNAAVSVTAVFSLVAFFTSSVVIRAIASSVLAGILFIVTRWVMNIGDDSLVSFLLGSLLALLAALLAMFRLEMSQRLLAFCLSLLVASTIFGAVNAPWRFSETQIAPSSLVSSADLKVFDWIRHETPRDSIFVTNRELCVEAVTCGFSGMPTATAFTQRGFVIEGLRTLTPAAIWRDEIPDRLMPLVSESRAYVDWAMASGSRPTIITRAGWILVYSDTKLAPLQSRDLKERYRSADGRIAVFEIVPE